MERTLSQGIAPSELALINGKGATPFAQQTVVLTKQAYIELTWQAHYWRAQYEQLVERETALKAAVEAHQATIRDLTQRLYGTKSEKTTHLDKAGAPPRVSLRKRGQQPGSPGHGRRACATLPVVIEVRDLSTAEKRCTVCGAAFRPFPVPEASTIIEVQVQAHVRRIQRQRYHKGGRCPQSPGIVTAPPAPQLIPKSPIGVSVWPEVLLDKYLYGRPTARLCQALQHHGGPLSQGPVTDGLRKITPLFEPVVQALRERQMGEKLFHGDEPRWEVFAALAGKVGQRWYLWVTRSVSVVFSTWPLAVGQMGRRTILPSSTRTSWTWYWCVTGTAPTNHSPRTMMRSSWPIVGRMCDEIFSMRRGVGPNSPPGCGSGSRTSGRSTGSTRLVWLCGTRPCPSTPSAGLCGPALRPDHACRGDAGSLCDVSAGESPPPGQAPGARQLPSSLGRPHRLG